MPKYLTIDVGGTNIKYALMTEEPEILDKGEVPTPYEGFDVFLEKIAGIYDKYKDQGVEAVAMSAPGRIDSSNGYFYTSGALKYISGINLAERLKEYIPVPFAVENDGKSAALAELWIGSMQGIKYGTVIVLGTGIGGGIIIDGKLYRGATFAAGEYSGISADLANPYDRRKVWASLNGVGKMVVDYANRVEAEPTAMNGRILFSRANEGDPDALDAIRAYCTTLATGIISLQTIIDVERVAIGGGISRQPILLKTLKEVIEEMNAPYVGKAAYTIPEIVVCSFGNDANMIGALYHLLYEMK